MSQIIDVDDVPQGRLVIGVYQGWGHVRKRAQQMPDGTMKEGEIVVGMYELFFDSNISGRSVRHRLTFSQNDQDGEKSKFQERVIEGDGLPERGTLVACRFVSKGTLSRTATGTAAFANDTATGLYVLARAGEFSEERGLSGPSIEEYEAAAEQ